MANEFIARKGLIALSDTQITGSFNVSSTASLTGLRYPIIDGTDGQAFLTDGTGNITIEDPNQVFVTIKNKTGAQLDKGTPVYASGSSGNASDVYTADATDNTKMPAAFIVRDDIAIDAEGKGVIAGFINGIDTSGFSAGDTIYVAGSGGYTNVKPTGSALIQNIGKAVKIDATNGSLIVVGAGRTNDVPNLPDGKIWVGSSTNTVTSSIVTIDEIGKKFTIDASGSTVFEIIGSEGQLFAVTDTLSGSLFAVSDVSGLPIIEVFSDDTVKIGSFNNQAIIVNGATAVVSGSFSGSFQGDGSALTGIASVDITDLNTFTGSIQTEVDTLTAATSSYLTSVPAGTISSSAQVDHDSTTNFSADEHFTQANITTVGTVTSGDVSAILPAGTVSSSAQVTITENQISDLVHYTDADVKTKLNTENVVSGSASSVRTFLNVEDGADVTDATNVQAAGALMDSEVTSLSLIKGLTAAQISGAFDAASASLAADIPTNNNQLTNGAGYLTTVDISTDTNLAGGTNLTLSGDTMNMDASINLTSVSIGGYSSLGVGGATLLDIGADASWTDIRYGKNGSPLHTFQGDIKVNNDITASNNVNIQGILSLPGFSNVSSSLAAAVASGDNLGNHIATQDLNMGGNNITSVGNVDGVDVSTLNSTVSTNTSNIATLTAATSSYSTATGVENNADVTDTANVTAAGALMDSEVTSLDLIKGLTAAQISGSFNAASASFSTRVTINDAKLTANTSNVTAAGALMDSEVTNLAQVKAFDSSDYATAAQGTKADTAVQPSQTGSFSTATGVEDNADVTDTANVTAAGALMDSEVTSLSLIKGLTAAQISGSFTSTSASLAANIPTNNNQLTNGAGYTTNTGTVTEVTVGTGLDVTNGTTTPNVTLDLTEVIASDAANRVLTSDGDGTLTAESELTYDGTTLNVDGLLDIDADPGGAGALVDINNTRNGGLSGDTYALKVTGGDTVYMGGAAYRAFGGHFTAGITTNAPDYHDSIALYAQAGGYNNQGGPFSYAAIFSGSNGVVGINTMEPTVELDVVGDISASGNVVANAFYGDGSNLSGISTSTTPPRITYLYTSSIGAENNVAANYIHYIDDTVDYILVSTSSYNNVDLDGSSTTPYAVFLYNEVGSLLTVRNVTNGAFRTFKVNNVTTANGGNGGVVRYDIQSLTFDVSSGSLSAGDEVEFIWDKSAGVGGSYSPSTGTSTKTLAGIYNSGYTYLDMFFGTGPDEFDGSPGILSSVVNSSSFGDYSYALPAISNTQTLTLGGLTVNGTLAITGFTDVSASLAAIPSGNELDGQYIEYFTRDSAYGNSSYEGQVVKYGTGTLSAGKAYVLRDNSGTALWDEVDADSEIQTKGLFGIALGTSPTTDGLLVRGIRSYTNSFTIGNPLYISLTAGQITDDISSHTTGDFVRVVGYALSTTLVYIDPSPDYIELS